MIFVQESLPPVLNAWFDVVMLSRSKWEMPLWQRHGALQPWYGQSHLTAEHLGSQLQNCLWFCLFTGTGYSHVCSCSLWAIWCLLVTCDQYCTICGKRLSWRQAEACAWLGSDSRCAHAGSDVWALTALIESNPLLGLRFTKWWISRLHLEHSGHSTPITALNMEM